MTDEATIRELIEAQIDAFRRKDAAATVAFLADDVAHSSVQLDQADGFRARLDLKP